VTTKLSMEKATLLLTWLSIYLIHIVSYKLTITTNEVTDFAQLVLDSITNYSLICQFPYFLPILQLHLPSYMANRSLHFHHKSTHNQM